MEIDNSDRQGWLNRGKILANLGKHQEALVCYEKAIEIEPDYYQSWDAHNLLRELLQCLELAELDFDRAIEEYKGNPTKVKESQHIAIPGRNIASSCYNRACLQALQGDWEQSLAYLEQAVNLDKEKYLPISQQDPDLDSIRGHQYFQDMMRNNK